MIVNTKDAQKILKSGGIVAIPTETVYGLAAMIQDESALKKIFSIKERPFFDPLIVHVSSHEMAQGLCKNWPKVASTLAKNLWPGPVTLVLEKSDDVNPLITSGLNRVGIRFPSHPKAIELIKLLNCPLAAPSANKFKRTSPTKVEHVEKEFNSLIPVLDGGDCEIGIESTVIGVFEDHLAIYRPGMINKDDIQKLVDIPVIYQKSPVAPGQLEHHYMPSIPIYLTFQTFNPDEHQLQNPFIWELENDPTYVARKLYQQFREAEAHKFESILIIAKEEYKNQDSWTGVINRIMKAKSFII